MSADIEKMVESIANELNAMSRNEYECPICKTIQPFREEEGEEQCPHCGNVREWEEQERSVWHYLMDDELYSEKFVVDADGTYEGCMLKICCGGPDIWLDTWLGVVRGYWGLDTASAPLMESAIREIDEVGLELHWMNC